MKKWLVFTVLLLLIGCYCEPKEEVMEHPDKIESASYYWGDSTYSIIDAAHYVYKSDTTYYSLMVYVGRDSILRRTSGYCVVSGLISQNICLSWADNPDIKIQWFTSNGTPINKDDVVITRTK